MQLQTLESPPRPTPKASLNLSLDGARAAERSHRIENAMQRAKQALLDRQNPAGYWVGELQGDSILESEYLLLMFILNLEHDPRLPKIANFLRNLQNPDGGW